MGHGRYQPYTVIIRNLFKIHNKKICGIADRLSSSMLALAF